MLRESSIHFLELTDDQACYLLEQIKAGKIRKFPIHNCVKFFARITSEETFSYARDKCDLGTKTISAFDITRKLNHTELQENALSALSAFEEVARDRWPFMPGSNSWLQIEVIRPPDMTVIVGRAVRLSPLGNENITTTRLLTKITSEVSSEASYSSGGWCIKFAKPKLVKSAHLNEPDANKILDMLISQNADSPLGFYMLTDLGKIRVIKPVKEYGKKQKYDTPLPIGVMK